MLIRKYRKKKTELKAMTLIEMVISITVFTLGIMAFTTLFVKGWQSNKLTLEEGQAAFSASKNVRDAVDIIRKARQGDNGAYTIESATNNDLKIYSNIDGDDDIEKVHYYLEGGNFKRGIIKPDNQTPPHYQSTDESVVTLVQNVNNQTQPLFTYYDNTGNQLTGSFQVSEVKMIKIYLRVNYNFNSTSKTIVVQSYVTPRNLINEE